MPEKGLPENAQRGCSGGERPSRSSGAVKVNGQGWRELPIGGKILQGGNSVEYETGSWRTFRPVVDKEKCINCMRCWLLCPDSAIYADNEEMAGYDYMHCKGCGLCNEICPVDAIEMVLETEKEKVEADERGIKVAEEGEKKQK